MADSDSDTGNDGVLLSHVPDRHKEVANWWWLIQRHLKEEDPKFYGVIGRHRKSKGFDRVEDTLMVVYGLVAGGSIKSLDHAKKSVLARLADKKPKATKTKEPSSPDIKVDMPTDWDALERRREDVANN